jgi:hypothetical protein
LFRLFRRFRRPETAGPPRFLEWVTALAPGCLPAMPLVTERERFFVGLMGLGVNHQLGCANNFAMIPMGPDPNATLTGGFFALGASQARKSMRRL